MATLGYAILNRGRLNAFRLNAFAPGLVFISIDGKWSTDPTAPRRVLMASLTIADRLNEEPNTCLFTLMGTPVAEGKPIVITIGTQNNTPLFAGVVLRCTQVYAADNPRHVQYQVEGIDWTWTLNRYLVTARYRSQSATTIAQGLMAFAPAGFSLSVPPDLPYIDEITYTNETFMDCFARLATRIGGYTFCDYAKTVQLFITYPQQNPTTLTPTHASLQNVARTRDLSQIVTRALVEGGGVNALGPASPGATVIAVDDTAWYSANGGRIVSGPQRLTYTGIIVGRTGTIVGPGVTPGTAPTGALQSGGAVDIGAHSYAYTWVTAAGETKPSPLLAVTTQGVTTIPTPPPGALTNISFADNYGNYTGSAPNWNATGNPPRIGDSVAYAITWSTSAGVDLLHDTDIGSGVGYVTVRQVNPVGLPAGWIVACSPLFNYLSTYPVPKGATYLHTWRSMNNGPWVWIQNHASYDLAGLWNDVGTLIGGATGAGLPTPNPVVPAQQTVALSGIAVGPTGVTKRRIYRTPLGSSQLKLVAEVADNTTTTYTDTKADAALGANLPGGDTSGLPSPTGQANPGDTVITIAGTGGFPASGWAIAGSQGIRYTGVTATQLTGIPTSGDGAIGASIPYGTPITVAPQITGIPASGTGAITWPILRGDPVNLFVIVDDASAQTVLASLIGGDGVIEASLVDNRISETEARARGQALLAERSSIRESVSYRVRDILTRSGAMITVALPAPTNITGSYRIQDVTISDFETHRPPTFPLFEVHASSSRFTFEDLLRRTREEQEQSGL